jgi:hypothetical protein
LNLIVLHAFLHFGLSSRWLVLLQSLFPLTDALSSCRSGGGFAADVAWPPLLQMLCCSERVGPIRGCFAASMVIVYGGCFAAVQFYSGCFAA